MPAMRQVLTLPNVGTSDLNDLDPALGPSVNADLAIRMIFSGLVKLDTHLNVVPDQATWNLSQDGTVYMFTLKSGIMFSDGTLVTTKDYISTWTRALLPRVNSPSAALLEEPIVGSDAVSAGKTMVLSGVQTVTDRTLRVKLKRPTPYFLEALTSSLFFPLPQKIIARYGQEDWVNYAVGTGPFMIKEWTHDVRMVFIPNPYYYESRPKLTEVIMPFVGNSSTAFNSYRAGQYDLVWNLAQGDQEAAKDLSGFLREPLLQTNLLFFDCTSPPFNQSAVRQAFATATDKATFVHDVLKDSAVVAQTIIPPNMPNYQSPSGSIPYEKDKAKMLLQSVYPNISQVPSITFSYSSSQLTQDEAKALQQMWQVSLGLSVKLFAIEPLAYKEETQKHLVQFGFTQWSETFPDPYDWLTHNLTSFASNNLGQWHNSEFDQTLEQAKTSTGETRVKLYSRAEQIAISDVGLLPLDHQVMAAIIPSWLHGVTLNANGLAFSDWSDVSIFQH